MKMPRSGFERSGTTQFFQRFEIERWHRQLWMLPMDATTDQAHSQRDGIEQALDTVSQGRPRGQTYLVHVNRIKSP